MRQKSTILEPHEAPDPYAAWTRNVDPLKKELAELPGLREPGRLADRVRRLYRDGVPPKPLKEVQFLLLHEAIPLAQSYIAGAIRHASRIGHGAGPLDHFWEMHGHSEPPAL